MMDNSIQIPLDLPDVRVLKVAKTKEGGRCSEQAGYHGGKGHGSPRPLGCNQKRLGEISTD